MRDLKTIYESWVPFESFPTAELKTTLRDAMDHPTPEWDTFFRQIVDDFDDESDAFWIKCSIKYAQSACDRNMAIAWLEQVLTQPERYGVLGGVFGMAASYLGMLATYPNEVLRRTITLKETGNPEMDAELPFARAAALGAYVMTATTVDYGFEVGRQFQANGELPTVEKAEALIRASTVG